MKVSEKVSLGGEGVEREADEGDAAGVRGGQGEQAKKQIYWSSHRLSNSCDSSVCQSSQRWPEPPDFLILLLLSHSLVLFDEYWTFWPQLGDSL